MFTEELVVIGIHSAKFPSEKLTENIRQAVLRHEIHHPVVNDAGFQIWQAFQVRAWPTVVLIDPTGKISTMQSGEISADEFAAMIKAMIVEFDSEGLLDRRPLDVRPEKDSEPARLLSFPTKLLVAPDDLLYIADTGNHRILEINLDPAGRTGVARRVFGSGEPDFKDGSPETAAFQHPHGMALSGNTLYVADTDNHAVRAIDLESGDVRTVAGTGQVSRGRPLAGAPREVSLRSPWALHVVEQVEALFIAMAGSHQIWVLLKETELGPFAGDGREALVDGSLAKASFNQPSDLAFGLGYLFVADPEASAIRAISLGERPNVFTLAGQGLFEFGDVDGQGSEVRLQHPTGITYSQERLFLADSYNHKIKVLDPYSGNVQTMIGTGHSSAIDGNFDQAGLNQPEGLTVFNNRLYIADTNNHLIRIADFDTRQLETLELRGYEKIHTPARKLTFIQRQASVQVKPGLVSMNLAIKMAKGYKINDEAPVIARWRLDSQEATAEYHAKEEIIMELQVLKDTSLSLDLTVYYCNDEDERLCMIHHGQMEVPLEVSPNAPSSFSIPYSILEIG